MMTTGELPDMLGRTAQPLTNQVDCRTLALTSLLEPILILIMGAVVLMTVLAVLLPIIEINQLVRYRAGPSSRLGHARDLAMSPIMTLC